MLAISVLTFSGNKNDIYKMGKHEIERECDKELSLLDIDITTFNEIYNGYNYV